MIIESYQANSNRIGVSRWSINKPLTPLCLSSVLYETPGSILCILLAPGWGLGWVTYTHIPLSPAFLSLWPAITIAGLWSIAALFYSSFFLHPSLIDPFSFLFLANKWLSHFDKFNTIRSSHPLSYTVGLRPSLPPMCYETEFLRILSRSFEINLLN